MNLHDQDTFLRGKNEGFEAGIQQGISQGAQQAKVQAAKNALSMNLSIEQIISLTGLSRETVEKLAKT